MMSSSVLSSLVVVLALLAGQVHCQVTQECRITSSQIMLGFRDIRCQCMENLQMDVQNIDLLTIDMSDCDELTKLAVSWPELEQGIGPRVITFIGAQISFAAPPTHAWNSNLQRIKFERCNFPSIPSEAFKGLNRLSELRFVNSYVAKVDSYAISNLGNLTTLEISDSEIGEIATNAISGLPNIFEVGLVRSNITTMKQGAIHNLKIPQLPVDQRCPDIDIRFGSDRDENAIGDIVGRKLESTDNLPLPEFGARLLIHQCNFTTIEKDAVESDLFAFVILGGNQISYLGSSAFKVELSNQCEISFLMLADNVFESVQPGALAFANAKLRATHKTFFVLMNNTFEYVAEGGFLLHPSIEIYTVRDNNFVCDCQFFEWIMGEPATKRQQELERDLLMNGKCVHQNLGVANFTSMCSDADYTTSFPSTTKYPINVVTLPEGATGEPGTSHMIEASSASTGRISWLLCLTALGLLFCLA